MHKEHAEGFGEPRAITLRLAPSTQTHARPEVDKVIVFKDFFTIGLRFPLDPTVVDIFQLYKVYTHQMTPNSFVW